MRKLLTEKHEIFSNIRGKAEGLAYPLALFVKEMDRYNESLKSNKGLVSFLSEVNDCQKGLMRALAETTPDNFGSMYCLDMLWKLVLIRFEFMLEDEDLRLNKVLEKSEVLV